MSSPPRQKVVENPLRAAVVEPSHLVSSANEKHIKKSPNERALNVSENAQITVNVSNSSSIKDYTDSLGLTSLYDNLEVLSNKKLSDKRKAIAIERLILLRLIISGKIKLRNVNAGLIERIQSALIIEKFNTIPSQSLAFPQEAVEGLINDLDSLPESGIKELKIFKNIIYKLLTIFSTTVVISTIVSLIGIGIKSRVNAEDVVKPGGYNALEIVRNNGITLTTYTPQDYYPTLNSLVNKIFIETVGVVGMNGFTPIIIGLLSTFGYALSETAKERTIIRTAIARMIDRFLSENSEIIRLINDKNSGFAIPSILHTSPLGIAVYSQYIRYIQATYRLEQEIKQNKEKELQEEIKERTLEKTFGVKKIKGLNDFLVGDDTCIICLDSLTGSSHGIPVKVCANNHFFHKTCIREWIESGHPECPLCKEVMGAIGPKFSSHNREKLMSGGAIKSRRNLKGKKRITRKA